jgi:DNA (cytosine-5)-methyltransferase 1
MQAKHGNGNGHGKSLSIEAQRLLPTPTDVTKGGGKSRSGSRSGEALLNGIDRLLPTPMVGDAASACNSTATRHKTPPTGIHAGDTLTDVIRGSQRWGDYAAAIARWEQALGRPAPEPTQLSSKSNPQLAAPFVEWMMGLPAGWVTDVPGITRNQALKALGNGVVPQQAAEALRYMLATMKPSSETA